MDHQMTAEKATFLSPQMHLFYNWRHLQRKGKKNRKKAVARHFKIYETIATSNIIQVKIKTKEQIKGNDFSYTEASIVVGRDI